MTTRTTLLTFFAACQLLTTGATHATGTRPTAQDGRPVPVRRVAAVARPVAPAPVLLAAAAPAPVAATTPQPEAAPRTVSVTGIILGADGQPRPGVSVFPTFNPRLIAITDAKGAFSLALPPTPGIVHLQADYFGVGSSRVDIDGQRPKPINIVLGQ
jgi:hypothetical protein